MIVKMRKIFFRSFLINKVSFLPLLIVYISFNVITHICAGICFNIILLCLCINIFLIFTIILLCICVNTFLKVVIIINSVFNGIDDNDYLEEGVDTDTEKDDSEPILHLAHPL